MPFCARPHRRLYTRSQESRQACQISQNNAAVISASYRAICIRSVTKDVVGIPTERFNIPKNPRRESLCQYIRGSTFRILFPSIGQFQRERALSASGRTSNQNAERLLVVRF